MAVAHPHRGLRVVIQPRIVVVTKIPGQRACAVRCLVGGITTSNGVPAAGVRRTRPTVLHDSMTISIRQEISI